MIPQSSRLAMFPAAQCLVKARCFSRPPLLLIARHISTENASNKRFVPLSSLSSEQLGDSILLTRKHLPPGSTKTPHELVAQGVLGAKMLSLSSSLAGFAMIPVVSSYLWEAASERPSMMAFAIVANSGLALLSFTPLLLHFLTKRFPIDIYYNDKEKIFTSVHYNFLIQKRALRFRASDVVDAAMAPEMKKIWIPLATLFVYGNPLLVSLDRRAYTDKPAFDDLTKNVNIPSDAD